MSTARKSHRKARTGCGHCKRRKIKCDEQKPACFNCRKHSIQCDFSQAVLSPGSTRADASVSSPGSHSLGSSGYHGGSTSSTTPLNSNPDNQCSDLNMVDLELLHNFTTSTCYTMSSKPDLKSLWQVVIPQLAFSQDFLMRGLLAISALHLAHFAPQDSERRGRYTRQAAMQQDRALAAVRFAMSNVTRENCDALFVFSTSVIVFTFAQPRAPDTLLFIGSQDQGMAEWLLLIRGVHTIIRSARDWIAGGPVSPMLKSGAVRSRSEDLEPPESDGLMELSELIKEATVDETELEAYEDAIQKLRICASDSRICHLAPAFSWPIRISDQYMGLLRKHTPEALAIFAHYSVLLKKLDGFWWIQGWGTSLLSTIYGLLGNEYRMWIRWPIQECGWIPPRRND